MSILKQNTATAFDNTAIHKGDLIRAKYQTWDKAQNGIVARVADEEIRVLYIPEAKNVTNYFIIKADEVSDGKWDISWSHDLTKTETEGEDNDA